MRKFIEFLLYFVPESSRNKFISLCLLLLSIALFFFTSCGSLKLREESDIHRVIEYQRSEYIYKDGRFIPVLVDSIK